MLVAGLVEIIFCGWIVPDQDPVTSNVTVPLLLTGIALVQAVPVTVPLKGVACPHNDDAYSKNKIRNRFIFPLVSKVANLSTSG